MPEKYHYFSISVIDDGIYAAIPDSGSNAGIINLGDQTLIFDTFTTIGAAKELKTAAEDLTGRPASYVINSHAHADHYQGNIVFSNEATLIASTKTRKAIAEEGVFRMERMRNSMVQQANELQNKLEQTHDSHERSYIETVLNEYHEFFNDYPNPEDLRLPDLTFEQSITFHGLNRTAELVTFGGAHSSCDAVLWLPHEKILFSADLIIPNDNVILSQGHPENWLPILSELEALNPRIIVPGHGEIVPATDGFAWVRYYLNYINKLIDELNSSKTTVDIKTLQAPIGCRKNWFLQNIRFLLDSSNKFIIRGF